MKVAEFAERCGGVWNGSEDAEITGFATDSREVKPGFLFIAIKGDRVDGHDFVRDVMKVGAVGALVTRPITEPHVLVESIEDALAMFGRSVRAEFSGPVVGITGSNGKTTTKEFAAAALSPLGKVLKSEGNKNTQYTSPLSWFRLTDEHKSVIVEMGMRGLGQIAHLAEIAQPTIGVITVVGTAHIEKVGTREGILEAKTELFASLPHDGTAIIWREDDFYDELKQRAPCPTLSFGTSEDADCRVIGYRSLEWGKCTVRFAYKGEEAEVNLPTFGRHQALNAAAAVLVAVSAGVKFSEAVEALAEADLPAMRLEILDRGGVTVLMDTYNASPDSTVAALEALAQGPAQARRIAILGEMKELGNYTEAGHRAVGLALAAANIDLALLTGGPTRFIYDEARQAGMNEDRLVSVSDLSLSVVRAFLNGARSGDTVLIKGSRALGLEKALEGWRA
ncbi:MAG: UDP-N-acetylmuramoyl-tripeptide--D-alanyl-D-alanine ligase [Fimbriimonadaceae bacterium]|nr:MAG: UDP-N-acetylmuramoyl-tripeptide--D-alanyl-D-alanine ligase [Fimbriimonadaceae bacterium]